MEVTDKKPRPFRSPYLTREQTEDLLREIAALRTAAEAAHPEATWEGYRAGPRTTKWYVGPKLHDGRGRGLQFKVEGEFVDFVCRASPRMILALLDRLDELEEQVQTMDNASTEETP